MNYYIQRNYHPGFLMHYGVKGMKWGVRHDPERTGSSSGRKKMSTAKKVAIGVAVAAAVGGASYYAIKTHKYNKAAHVAVKRILNRDSTQNWVRNTANNMWGFDGSYRSNPYSLRPGRYSRGKHRGGNSTFHYFSNNGKINNDGHRLTGHSARVTKAGAASHRGMFYSERAAKTPVTSDYFTNPNTQRRILERKADKAWTELKDIQVSSIKRGNGVPNRYNYTSIPRLKRQKGPRVLRVRG